MDYLTRAKADIEARDIAESEAILALFPSRFHLFTEIGHLLADEREMLARRLGLIPTIAA